VTLAEQHEACITNPFEQRALSENSAACSAGKKSAGAGTRSMLDVRLRILLVALAGWVNRHQLRSSSSCAKRTASSRSTLTAACGSPMPSGVGWPRMVTAWDGRSWQDGDAGDAGHGLRWHRELIARKWTTQRGREDALACSATLAF
jgi:hypothetical protein